MEKIAESTKSRPFTVIITGPENSGKSTLAKSLARAFNCPLVLEFSREYLQDFSGEYEESDLIRIAKGQNTLLKAAQNSNTPLVIADTGQLVINIWNKVKFRKDNPTLDNLLDAEVKDLYILPHFDIPYEEDPLRESRNERNILYTRYLHALERQSLPFFEVDGNPEERLVRSAEIIKTLISTR